MNAHKVHVRADSACTNNAWPCMHSRSRKRWVGMALAPLLIIAGGPAASAATAQSVGAHGSVVAAAKDKKDFPKCGKRFRLDRLDLNFPSWPKVNNAWFPLVP